jgi:hypothetical protein
VLSRRLVIPFALLATLFSLCAGTIQSRSVAAEEIQFYVSSAIDADDAMYVREGIRLGQDYVAEQIGVEMETQTIVNAVPAAPRGNVDLVGLSTSSLHLPRRRRLHRFRRLAPDRSLRPRPRRRPRVHARRPARDRR